MVLVKNWPFFHLFILTNIGQENVFYNILERKNAFYAIKTTSPKSRKIDIFPKGLVHAFGPNLAIFFYQIFLGNINVFFSILERKNIFLGYKARSSKSRQIDIFPKSLVFVKNWPFFHLFILTNIGQENVFYNILERINGFLSHKNRKSKKSKKRHFSKGVSPWFWSKIGPFSIFLF